MPIPIWGRFLISALEATVPAVAPEIEAVVKTEEDLEKLPALSKEGFTEGPFHGSIAGTAGSWTVTWTPDVPPVAPPPPTTTTP